MDHCGGNNYFNDNYPGIITYSTFKEKLFMENNDLMPYAQFGSFPAKEIKKKFKKYKGRLCSRIWCEQNK